MVMVTSPSIRSVCMAASSHSVSLADMVRFCVRLKTLASAEVTVPEGSLTKSLKVKRTPVPGVVI